MILLNDLFYLLVARGTSRSHLNY